MGHVVPKLRHPYAYGEGIGCVSRQMGKAMFIIFNMVVTLLPQEVILNSSPRKSRQSIPNLAKSSALSCPTKIEICRLLADFIVPEGDTPCALKLNQGKFLPLVRSAHSPLRTRMIPMKNFSLFLSIFPNGLDDEANRKLSPSLLLAILLGSQSWISHRHYWKESQWILWNVCHFGGLSY